MKIVEKNTRDIIKLPHTIKVRRKNSNKREKKMQSSLKPEKHVDVDKQKDS